MIDTCTEQQSGWKTAKEHFGDMYSEGLVNDMLEPEYSWQEGVEWKRIDGEIWVNPEAMRAQNRKLLHDFLHSELADKRTALYRHFDSEGELLYVGVSLDPDRRLKQHKETDWFDNVADSSVEWFDDRKTALAAELAAIQSEGPKHNIAHKIPEDDDVAD